MAKTVTCVDVHGKKYEISIDQLRWRPSVYGIIIEDGAVLLSPQFDGYDLPGGGVNLGEMPEVALLREIKEETGLTAANPHLLTVQSSFFMAVHAKPPASVQSLMLYYQCDFAGGRLSTDGFDEYEKKYAGMPEWFPISQLASIKVKHSFDWRELVKGISNV